MDTYDQLENFIAKKKLETTKKPKQPQITKKEKTIMPGLMGAVEKLKSKKLVDEIKDEEFEHTLEEENTKSKQIEAEFDLMNIPKTKPKKEIGKEKKPDPKQKPKIEEKNIEDEVENELEEDIEEDEIEEDIEEDEIEEDIEEDEINDAIKNIPKKIIKHNSPKPIKKIIRKPVVKKKPRTIEQEYDDEDFFEEDYDAILKLKSDNKKLKLKLVEISNRLEETQKSKENMKNTFVERENYYKSLLKENNNKSKPQTTQPIEKSRSTKTKSIIINLVGLFIALFGFWISTEPKSMDFLVYSLQIGMFLIAIGISLFMSDKV